MISDLILFILRLLFSVVEKGLVNALKHGSKQLFLRNKVLVSKRSNDIDLFSQRSHPRLRFPTMDSVHHCRWRIMWCSGWSYSTAIHDTTYTISNHATCGHAPNFRTAVGTIVILGELWNFVRIAICYSCSNLFHSDRYSSKKAYCTAVVYSGTSLPDYRSSRSILLDGRPSANAGSVWS